MPKQHLNTEIIPREVLRSLSIEHITDAIACPWRYRRHWLEKGRDHVTDRTFVERSFWKVVRQIVRSKTGTGLPLMMDDVAGMAESTAREGRKDVTPALIERIQKASWLFYDAVLRDQKVLGMDMEWSIRYVAGITKSSIPRWSMEDKLPLILRSESRPYPIPVVVQLVDQVWDTHRLHTSLELIFHQEGAKKLGLTDAPLTVYQITSDKVHELSPVFDDEEVGVALVMAHGVRQVLFDLIYSKHWYPNRTARDCSHDRCAFALGCEKKHGGTVRP